MLAEQQREQAEQAAPPATRCDAHPASPQSAAMAGKPVNIKAVTVRIDGKLADRARLWVRDQAGRPLYLTLNSLVAMALERELERQQLMIAGALPMDRSSRGHSDPEDAERPTGHPRINAKRT
jgi:hypothetical protein